MYAVTFTADKYTEESLNEGIAAESGYINPSWSMTEFMAEEDAGMPTGTLDTYEEAVEYITRTLGYCEASGDSYYATDSSTDGEGNKWNYAGHIDPA